MTTLKSPMPQPLADYLHQLHQVIVPFLVAQGLTPNAINAREALANLTHTFVTEAPTMAKILDTVLLTPSTFRGYPVPLRLFIPSTLAPTNKDNPTNVPILVFFHGGGGMAGSVSVYDKIYKKLADTTGYLVVAPEYRLAPENRNPCAIEDAHAVLQFLTPTLQALGYQNNGTLMIGGDSGGGAITATLVQDWLANKIDTDLVITHQLLIYAGLDYTLSQPSMQENATGYLLETSKVQWYYDNYFNRYDDRELASPFWTDLATLAHHSPNTLPKTLNISAGYDPLRDEDIGYHEQLLKAGFDSQWVHFADMPHAFLNMENLCAEQCQQMYQAVGDFAKKY
ncbi:MULTISPECIES: alpha/beta hydrolase fold domain-containing protein [unclassified Moraxella]|uniref:alpha/beta hydrolase fold domain-containing protein n=1 Tax=unclassified Moraxella TaxID=2685852 RepID=UPI003AF5AF21